MSHQGNCGACSDLYDLGTYMTKNLSFTQMLCVLMPTVDKGVQSFADLWDVTKPCAQMCYYDVIHSATHGCFWKCTYNVLTF